MNITRQLCHRQLQYSGDVEESACATECVSAKMDKV